MTVWGRTRNSLGTKGEQQWHTYTLLGSSQHGYPAAPAPVAPFRYASLGSRAQTTCDFVHPNFKSRIANGEILNSPFLSTIMDETLAGVSDFSHVFRKTNDYWCTLHTPNQLHDRYWKTTGTWRLSPPAYLEVSSVTRSAMRQRVIDLAVTQAHANIDVNEMMALATVAEGEKTVKSMQAILWRAYKILKQVRKLQFASLKVYRKLQIRDLKQEIKPKELADRYMEARYAIRPLIYDAKGMMAALNLKRGIIRKTSRGAADDSIILSDKLLAQGNGLWMTNTDWDRTATYTVSAQAGVMCDVSVTDLTAFGVDMTAETLWELAPWSFIADWFANTGDWIAANTPNTGVNQRASWVTVKSTHTCTRVAATSRSVVDTVGYVKVSLTVPPCRDERKELILERQIEPQLSAFPVSRLRLDTFKLLDLGIILRKLF